MLQRCRQVPQTAGKRSLVRSAIAEHLAHNGIQRSDWVCVPNFEKPHQPVPLRLPAGGGARLRADMRALVDEFRAPMPAAFDSERYASALERLNTELKERAERGRGVVGGAAARPGDDPHAGGFQLHAAQARQGDAARGVRGPAGGRTRTPAVEADHQPPHDKGSIRGAGCVRLLVDPSRRLELQPWPSACRSATTSWVAKAEDSGGRFTGPLRAQGAEPVAAIPASTRPS